MAIIQLRLFNTVIQWSDGYYTPWEDHGTKNTPGDQMRILLLRTTEPSNLYVASFNAHALVVSLV